ncbi:MAG: radical SAM protein [Candidatus Alcyoniella australis]|nr:radical SAM protein [Candidatus Alcyoniella australis]
MYRGPTHATIAVTSRCNSRCAMCSIWQREQIEEIEPSVYFRLPQSLVNVNITGGEPFLRPNILQVVTAISERLPKARLVISTNGLATEKIADITRQILDFKTDIGVRVSLDGRPRTHDQLRGIPGAYNKALRTLERLRAIGVADLGLAFTLARGNEAQLLYVHELCRKLGVEFSLSMVHSSPHFFGDHDDFSPDPELAMLSLERLIRRQLYSLHPKSWGRAYFSQGLIDRLCNRGRPLPCGAIRDLFHLDPFGRVYPCNMLDAPMGNLAQQTYAQMVAEDRRGCQAVRDCSLACWMVCTAAPAMRRNRMSVLWWVAKRAAALTLRREPETCRA